MRWTRPLLTVLNKKGRVVYLVLRYYRANQVLTRLVIWSVIDVSGFYIYSWLPTSKDNGVYNKRMDYKTAYRAHIKW